MLGRRPPSGISPKARFGFSMFVSSVVGLQASSTSTRESDIVIFVDIILLRDSAKLLLFLRSAPLWEATPSYSLYLHHTGEVSYTISGMRALIL